MTKKILEKILKMMMKTQTETTFPYQLCKVRCKQTVNQSTMKLSKMKRKQKLLLLHRISSLNINAIAECRSQLLRGFRFTASNIQGSRTGNVKNAKRSSLQDFDWKHIQVSQTFIDKNLGIFTDKLLSCLLLHPGIHTGERPFVCDVCNLSFAQGNALKCHKRE